MKLKDVLKPKSYKEIMEKLNANPIIIALNGIPKNKWAEVHCSLNCWKIPNSLKRIKCSEFENYGPTSHFPLIWSTMKYIEYILGKREVSRYWNVEYLSGMTEEEFDKWWQKHKKR